MLNLEIFRVYTMCVKKSFNLSDLKSCHIALIYQKTDCVLNILSKCHKSCDQYVSIKILLEHRVKY